MTINEILDFITTNVFSIVMCVMLMYAFMWYIKYTTENAKEKDKQHSDESSELRRVLEANTTAITTLTEVVRGLDKR